MLYVFTWCYLCFLVTLSLSFFNLGASLALTFTYLFASPSPFGSRSQRRLLLSGGSQLALKSPWPVVALFLPWPPGLWYVLLTARRSQWKTSPPPPSPHYFVFPNVKHTFTYLASGTSPTVPCTLNFPLCLGRCFRLLHDACRTGASSSAAAWSLGRLTRALALF